ncbi:MAG: Imm7 family immunity protein [Bacteroidota bacterium]
MIQINGWAEIRESFNEEGEDEKLLDEITNKIRAKIAEMNYSNEVYDLRRLNGVIYLTITVSHNHRQEHPIEFFKWVASIAVGSYGLLYVQDDEDIERGNENKFKVWRMKKGNVDELDDPFLSPIIPEIEE